MGWTKERKEHYQIISVEVPRSFNERLEACCKERGLTKSELLRLALREQLGKRPAQE